MVREASFICHNFLANYCDQQCCYELNPDTRFYLLTLLLQIFFLQGWILGWWGIRSLLPGYFGCVIVIKEMPFDKISTVLWDGSKTCWKYQGQNCNGIFVWSDHHYLIKIINVSFTDVLMQLRDMQVVILFNNKPFLNK